MVIGSIVVLLLLFWLLSYTKWLVMEQSPSAPYSSPSCSFRFGSCAASSPRRNPRWWTFDWQSDRCFSSLVRRPGTTVRRAGPLMDVLVSAKRLASNCGWMSEWAATTTIDFGARVECVFCILIHKNNVVKTYASSCGYGGALYQKSTELAETAGKNQMHVHIWWVGMCRPREMRDNESGDKHAKCMAKWIYQWGSMSPSSYAWCTLNVSITLAKTFICLMCGF